MKYMAGECDHSFQRRPGERRRLVAAALPALLLACGALAVAGCGIGDDEPDPPATEEPETPGEGDGIRGEPADDDADEPADDVARRIRDACREIAERAPAMPEGVRRDVIAECEEAASDDAEAARTAADAACEAFAAAVAPGPLRGAVADACRRALPDPAEL